MAATYPMQTNPGSFVATTYLLDPAEIQQADIPGTALKEILVRLYQSFNSTSLSMNTRDAGYYVQEEFVCGQIYYPNPANTSTTGTRPAGAEFRQVFRKVIDFGALPNNATKSVAHGIMITSGFSFTRIYATATNPSTAFIPIPFASSTAGDIISLDVYATNVNITTASDKTAFTITYVVLEYIKS
jgi:hypothetical protein